MSVIPATLVRYRHGRYSRNMLERDLDAIRNLYRGQRVSRRDGHLPRAGRLQRRQGAHRHLSSTSPKARNGSFPSSAFEGVSDDFRPALMLLLHSTEGQPYSDLNIASDRDNVLDYYFNNGYPAAKFDFTAVPAAQADRREPDVYRDARRASLRAQRGGGWAEAHPAGSGDGPHQPARGRSAVAKRDQRKPAPAVRSRHFFARGCSHPKPRRRRAHQIRALFARRSRTIFHERRRGRGNRAHRRRHHVARFAGRHHRFQPALLVSASAA